MVLGTGLHSRIIYIKNRTDFVTFTCLYFAADRCSAELEEQKIRDSAAAAGSATQEVVHPVHTR